MILNKLIRNVAVRWDADLLKERIQYAYNSDKNKIEADKERKEAVSEVLV